MLDVAPGAVIAGDFEIVRPLKRGGMGAVYVARQRSTEALRAVKVLLPVFGTDPKHAERFSREAKIVPRIDSDHVVQAIAAGFDEALGLPWLAMELLEGEDLDDLVQREGAVSVPRVREIFRQLAHPLARAHELGIVHRDLKPGNIFLAKARTEGLPFMVKVLDFGIAKLADDGDLSPTASIGSPAWMAPEQLERGGRVSPKTDVWALGLIGFHLLTGASYWRSANVESQSALRVLSEIALEPIEPASRRAEELGKGAPPPGFDEWFGKCLQRAPAHRFEDGDAAANALVAVLDGAKPSLVATRPLDATAPAPLAAPGRPEPTERELPEVRHEQAFHLRGFCGREELLAEVDRFIESGPGPALLLVGGPGAGKSAIAAAVAARHDAPLHMMKGHASPSRFLASLLGQAARRAGIELARDAFEGSLDDLRNTLVRTLEVVASTRSAVPVVIDALDELDDLAGLEALPPHPPPGVRLVLTARPDQALLRAVRARLPELAVLEVPPLSTEDVGKLVARHAADAAARVDVAKLTERTGGLALLVRRALEGGAAALEVDSLPSTLEDLFDGVAREIAGGGDERQRVLALLAVAREGLDAKALSELLAVDGAGVPVARCREHLAAMSEYLLEVQRGAFVPWHRGLSEHVVGSVLGADGTRELHDLFARWTSPSESEPAHRYGPYALRHRVAHLRAANRVEDARTQAEDIGFIESKIAAGLVFDLIAELEALGSTIAPALRRHAHFIVRHPYALATVLAGGLPAHSIWLERVFEAAHEGVAPVFTLAGHDGEVLSVAVATDGSHVVSAAADGTVRSWRTEDGRELDRTKVSARRALSLSIAADGRLFCGADGEGLRIFADNGQQAIQLAQGREIWSVAHARKGGVFATGSRSGEVALWHASGEPIASFVPGGIVTSLAFSPDGKTLAAGTSWNRIVLADAMGTIKDRIDLDSLPWSLLYAGDPPALLVACADGTLARFEGTEKVEETSVLDDRLYALALSSDETLLAFGGARGITYVMDAAGGSPSPIGRQKGWVNALAFVPKGDIVVAGSSDKTVCGFRVGARALAEPMDSKPSCAAFSPDGTLLVAGSFDGSVTVRNGEGKTLGRVEPHAAKVNAVAFDRAGALVATASRDKTARVYKAAQITKGGRPLASLVGHDAAVTAVTFVPPSGRVATGSSDRTVRVWTVLGAREVSRFEHDDTVIALASDASGGRVAALSRSGSLVVWDIASGDILMRIADATPEAFGRSVRFTSDPDAILVEARDGSWKGWATSTREALAPRTVALKLGRWALVPDARYAETVLVDRHTAEARAAYPDALEPICPAPDGKTFAAWVGGQLELLRVVE